MLAIDRFRKLLTDTFLLVGLSVSKSNFSIHQKGVHCTRQIVKVTVFIIKKIITPFYDLVVKQVPVPNQLDQVVGEQHQTQREPQFRNHI